METTTDTRTVTIDATGKRIGRLASEIAHIILGKDTTGFAKNVVAPVRVEVTHVDALDVSEKKRTEKVYDRYSGFHGGRKEETLEEVVAKKGMAEVLRRAVYNMLPANRLRNERMKNVTIS